MLNLYMLWKMAPTTLCNFGNFGNFLPSPKQANLLQAGISSLKSTFLTSLSPSPKDLVRGIIVVTHNFRRKKMQTRRLAWVERGH